VDVLHRIGERALDDPVLYVLKAVAVRVEDREVAVDQGIQQRVGEVVAAEATNALATGSDPLAHRLEAVAPSAPGR